MPHDITKIRHQFSVWAASRAAMAGSSKAKRKHFIAALDACGVTGFIKTKGQVVYEPGQVDAYFDRWVILVRAFLRKNFQRKVSYGICAKLIATYIKSAFTLAGNEATSFARHCPPPIDSVLLKGVDGVYGTKLSSQYKWQQLSRSKYWKVVCELRRVNHGRPFWELERHWNL